MTFNVGGGCEGCAEKYFERWGNGPSTAYDVVFFDFAKGELVAVDFQFGARDGCDQI